MSDSESRKDRPNPSSESDPRKEGFASMRAALALAVILTVLLSIPVGAHFSGVKICIDPGHGGSDPGALGNGLRESDVNLDISLRTRGLMQLDAATVVMTRTTDVYVSLQGRCDVANNAGAARFICSHCNAFNSSASGTETFCHPSGSSNSYDLRNKVQAEMVAHMGTINRGGKTNTFYVLSYTNMPAILAEVAFIDSPSDGPKLANPAYRQAAALAYLNGLQTHYGQATHDPSTTPLDSTYRAQSYQATMMAGTTATVWVEYNNTGTETWTNSGGNPVRLGTSNPQERSSVFYTPGDWIGPNRPTNMDQASCAPGGYARFSFTMTAPQTPGTYTEYWRLLKEGTAWFGYSGAYFTITVTPALGSISGTVKNTNSANPIPGASVSLNTGPSTQTNGLGVYSFSGLAAATYTVSASAPGYAGNSAQAIVTAGQATTTNINLTPTDTQPPSTPTNLAATTVSSTQINLTWTASTDNVGVAGYKVYRGGSQVGTATTNSYADNGVSPNTLYSYQVRAYDLAENSSGLSNTDSATTLPTTVAVFQDGFPDLNGWTADVVFDGSTRGVAWNATHNHGTFTGGGNAETLIGGGAVPGTNGCWSYKSFPRPFAAGRYEGWFYDTAANNNSRQGIHLRGYQGTTLAFSVYVGTYSATSWGNYSAGVYPGSGVWAWQTLVARSVGWHKFTIEFLPYTGSNDMKFYVDDSLKHTTNRPATTNTYGISRTYLGHNYNVNQSGWFDDLGFYADPPLSPTITAPTALSATSIRWNYTDNSDKEAGFDLHDTAQTQKGTSAMNINYITESGLVANTRYTRHVHGYNGTLDSAQSLDASAYALSTPPTSSNVTCLGRTSNTAYGTPGFAFGAVEGFGTGKVEYYRVAWDQLPSYAWTGSETQWGSGDLSVTATIGGNWYLHAKGYNGDGVENGSVDLGPYVYDATPPSAPTVSDDGKYTGSTSQLHASWAGAEDPESAIVKYYYAIGIDPGSTEIADWTETTSTSVTRSGLSLDVGSSYYFSVKAENEVGLVGGIGMSDGIMVVQTVDSIVEAKALDNETLLALDGNIVSANYTDHFYIEDSDRLSGIRVDASSPEEGRSVSVAGKLDTVGGERVLTEATVFPGDLPGAPRPLLMLNRTLGGGDLNDMARGVTGGFGINNIGLLVRATGRVTHADVGFCYIDDGSGIQDGAVYDVVSTYTGVKLDTTKLTILPVEDQYILVIGISGVEMVNTDFIRVLKPRRDADIVIYP